MTSIYVSTWEKLTALPQLRAIVEVLHEAVTNADMDEAKDAVFSLTVDLVDEYEELTDEGLLTGAASGDWVDVERAIADWQRAAIARDWVGANRQKDVVVWAAVYYVGQR